VQVDPIKPMLKAPRTKGLKLKYDEPLSNFASKFNVRRYTEAHVKRCEEGGRASASASAGAEAGAGAGAGAGRGDGGVKTEVTGKGNGKQAERSGPRDGAGGGGLHSLIFQLNLSRV